jgi:hypothetical protein
MREEIGLAGGKPLEKFPRPNLGSLKAFEVTHRPSQ